MRNQFAGYYRPTEEQFSKLWKECIFVFDANTILNVYRYTSDTRESFLGILDRFKDRIWITHQAALEYHEKRLEVISQQLALYDQIDKGLKESLGNLKKILDSYRRHPLIDIPQMMEVINSSYQKIESYIDEVKAKHPDYLASDDLRDRITQLFDTKVGTPYSVDEIERKYKEAEIRYKRQIPPGYEDSGKDGVRKYGDFIIWSQLLDFAKSQEKPLIFITDDAKEDWWSVHKGKTIGPRPELMQEMYNISKKAFYIYNADQFIKYSLKFLELKDQPQVVEEAKDIRQRDQDENNIARYYAQIIGSGIAANEYPKIIPPPSGTSSSLIAYAQEIEKFQALQNPVINDFMEQFRGSVNIPGQNTYSEALAAAIKAYNKILGQNNYSKALAEAIAGSNIMLVQNDYSKALAAAIADSTKVFSHHTDPSDTEAVSTANNFDKTSSLTHPRISKEEQNKNLELPIHKVVEEKQAPMPAELKKKKKV